MAYVRFVEADLYIFMNVHGYLECCGCILGNDGDFLAYDTDSMVRHVKDHLNMGHYVPDWLIPSIQADDELNFGKETK
jgi:hypothetical protein